MANDAELLSKIEASVINGDADLTKKLTAQSLAQGINPFKTISDGLAKGMKTVGDKYESCEYYLPEVIIASQAMYAGLDVLKPHLKVNASRAPGKIVLGTIEGDVHDIGKNLVKLMYIAAGWDVYDMGQDVPLQAFVDKAKEVGANVIATSALMTTSMVRNKDLVQLIVSNGLQKKVGLLIGGAPVSKEYAEEIGAKGFAPDAVKAVQAGEQIILDLTKNN